MGVGYVCLLRLADGEIIDDRRAHAGQVNAVAFTPDGSHLISGGDDGKLFIWELS